ncbi:hypothetical protein Anapl_11596 [Anas platyrhynchos]|uniref:Uncharacterized protein n=1 Tax=Anas platyrhynchos TaxID=8839 RepID=R0JYW9_ANAPL|nr:hypothetical protein Anapl_11596 [Anas platyrhynchos]
MHVLLQRMFLANPLCCFITNHCHGYVLGTPSHSLQMHRLDMVPIHEHWHGHCSTVASSQTIAMDMFLGHHPTPCRCAVLPWSPSMDIGTGIEGQKGLRMQLGVRMQLREEEAMAGSCWRSSLDPNTASIFSKPRLDHLGQRPAGVQQKTAPAKHQLRGCPAPCREAVTRGSCSKEKALRFITASHCTNNTAPASFQNIFLFDERGVNTDCQTPRVHSMGCSVLLEHRVCIRSITGTSGAEALRAGLGRTGRSTLGRGKG